jgi:hypothetical protein
VKETKTYKPRERIGIIKMKLRKMILKLSKKCKWKMRSIMNMKGKIDKIYIATITTSFRYLNGMNLI